MHDPIQPFLSNQFKSRPTQTIKMMICSADNYSFRQHQFFHGNRFNYGIYTGGFDNNDDLRSNRWGLFVSWRQPFLREWFLYPGDIKLF